jgi:hypothetical protein
VHLAEVHVIQAEHEGVGRDQFEIGAILQRERRFHPHVQSIRTQRFDVIVIGIEAVIAQVFDVRDQCVELGHVLPGGRKLLRLVKLRHQFVGDDAVATYVVLLLVAQVVDAIADGFGQRSCGKGGGGRCDFRRLHLRLCQRGRCGGVQRCSERGRDRHAEDSGRRGRNESFNHAMTPRRARSCC